MLLKELSQTLTTRGNVESSAASTGHKHPMARRSSRQPIALWSKKKPSEMDVKAGNYKDTYTARYQH